MNTELILLDKKTSTTIQAHMPDNAVCKRIAEFFASFGDATRIKILTALSFGAMCVSDLCALTSINQTTASHQLKFLKTAGLVRSARQGKIMFYEIIPTAALNSLMEVAVDQIF